MKKTLGLIAASLIVILCFSTTYAAPIAIRTSAISDLSNYLLDPLFSPYFEPGTTTIIDFEGPWSPPVSGSYFNLGLVGSTYNDLGAEFGVDDGFMGGQSGFGYVTPTTVVGNAQFPYSGPITIDIVVPGTNTPSTVTSIGAFVIDGPTNDVTAKFYDINNQLIGSVTADPRYFMFLGWSDPGGVHRMEFTTAGLGDDYFIDNLTFTSPTPILEPASMLLLGSGLVGLAGFRRKFRKR